MFYQIIHTGKDTKKRWNAQAVRPRFLRCGFSGHRRLRPAYARTQSWCHACGSISPRLWHKGEGAAAVEQPYGGRHTGCTAAVVRACDGRRTTRITQEPRRQITRTSPAGKRRTGNLRQKADRPYPVPEVSFPYGQHKKRQPQSTRAFVFLLSLSRYGIPCQHLFEG